MNFLGRHVVVAGFWIIDKASHSMPDDGFLCHIVWSSIVSCCYYVYVIPPAVGGLVDLNFGETWCTYCDGYVTGNYMRRYFWSIDASMKWACKESTIIGWVAGCLTGFRTCLLHGSTDVWAVWILTLPGP